MATKLSVLYAIRSEGLRMSDDKATYEYSANEDWPAIEFTGIKYFADPKTDYALIFNAFNFEDICPPNRLYGAYMRGDEVC